ncbi:hypothetical protein N0V83_007584 [Neocucurbitaria cava]|uniref:Uncharacterized protein n=1 Tax=Neocucurbitaria cava TaxID=798079 RepID=A0A9W9CK47_9PLEO|nr:hypothetical protein N0V83_007584 [Neocucurbitaria cava]
MGAYIGYPSGMFLHGLVPWCMMETRQLLEQNDRLGQITKERKVISISERVQDLALDLGFSFCDQREHMPFLSRKPAYSWLTSRFSAEYNSLEKGITESISSSRPQGPRTVYNAKALLLPWTFELLKDYRPLDWSRRFQRRCRDTHKSHFHPCKLLATQLIILDMGIRLQIKGSARMIDGRVDQGIELQDIDLDQDFSRSLILEAPCIVAAIVNSHTLLRSVPSQTATDVKDQELKYQPWDLSGALRRHCTFYDNDMEPNEAAIEYERLAIMLKLRALFFLAFLMIGPDTSSVYKARESQAQVPII